jgi:hypothetical protein
MATKRLGKLPPRYSFILNPHKNLRLSKCPRCQKLTYTRKFALLIHIDGFGSIVLGKTCRYCSRCELIMAHQNELEGELALNLSRLAPGMIGNDYLVLGTIDKKVWKAGLTGEGTSVGDALKHLADFKQVYHDQPAGWYPDDDEAKRPETGR